MGRRLRDQQIKILSIVGIAVLTLSIGFAAFSTVLRISSSAKVNPNKGNFSVYFSSSSSALETDNIVASTTGRATGGEAVIMNSVNPTITGLSANFKEPGEEVSYTFWVRNDGEYLAYLTSIVFDNVNGADSHKVCTPGEGASPELVSAACEGVSVTVELDGITSTSTQLGITGSTLDKGESKVVKVTIAYDQNATPVDGPVRISFGDIYVTYGSIETDEFPTLPSQNFDIWDGTSETTLEDLSINEENKLVQINSAADLIGYRNAINNGELKGYTAMLNTSIDLAGQAWTPIGTSSNKFEGIFDGNGYTISNINIVSETSESVGFFRVITGDSTIKNLNLSGGKVSTKGSYSAGLVASTSDNSNITIENCTVDLEVTALASYSSVGGIVGYLGNSGTATIANSENYGTIKGPGVNNSGYDYTKAGGIVGYSAFNQLVIANSKNYGDVLNANYVGGILGNISYGTTGYTIENSINYGNIGIKNDTDTAIEAGGIVGEISSSTGLVSNCKNFGNVTSTKHSGGIVGYAYNYTVVDDCENNGDITGPEFAGGIVGVLPGNGDSGMKITDSINNGSVTCANGVAGGIVSHMRQGTVTGSSNTGTITSFKWTGGIIGRIVSGTISDCQNSGKIVSTGYTEGSITNYDYLEMYAAGGIAGSNHGFHSGGYGDSIVSNSTNSGEIEAVLSSGGIVGISLNNSTIENSHNTGTAKTTKGSVGGVLGYAFVESQNAGQKIYITSCSGGTNTLSGGRPGRIVGNIMSYDTGKEDEGVYITLGSNNDSRDLDIVGSVSTNGNHTRLFLIGTIPEWINGEPKGDTSYNSNISIYYNGTLTWQHLSGQPAGWTTRPN